MRTIGISVVKHMVVLEELLYSFGMSCHDFGNLADGGRIYGGGYVAGSKGGAYNPSGLIKASQNTGSQGIIFVAMNYRLGAFGFLAGPTLQGSAGVSNAAFYDQRLAIEWVAQNIAKFGGDPQRTFLANLSRSPMSSRHMSPHTTHMRLSMMRSGQVLTIMQA